MDEVNKTIRTSRSYVWILIVVALIIIGGGVFYYYYTTNSNVGTTAVAVMIDNCNAISPKDTALIGGGTLVFKNNDSASHTISIAGNEIIVPAGGSTGLSAQLLKYGPGTYGYACDGVLTGNEINLLEMPGGAPSNAGAFKAMYDSEPTSTQSCIKAALGSEFDQAYGSSGYIPSSRAIAGVQSCLAASSTTATTTK